MGYRVKGRLRDQPALVDCWSDRRHGEFAAQRSQTIERVYHSGGLTRAEYESCRSALWDEASQEYVAGQR